MIGWWHEVEGDAVPIKPNNTDFKVTTYLHRGEAALVVLVPWGVSGNSLTPVPVSLTYDWTALGLNSTEVRLHAPVIRPFQLEEVAGNFSTSETFAINATQGGLIFILQ